MTTRQITSAEFTARASSDAVYSASRGDSPEAPGLDPNRKGVRVATGSFALQARFGDKWVTTTRDSKDEMRYQATGNKTYGLIARVA